MIAEQTRAWTGVVQRSVLRWHIRLVHIGLLLLVLKKSFWRRGRAAEDYATIDATSAVQIGLVLGLAIVVLLCCRPRQLGVMVRGRAAAWFIAIHVLGAVSALWSANWLYSGYFAFEVLVLTYAVFVAIGSYNSLPEAERNGLICLLGIALFVLIHRSRLGMPLSVASLHTVTSGCLGAMVACYSMAELSSRAITFQRRRFLRVCCILGLVLVVVSTSSATNVAMLAGLPVVALTAEKRSTKALSLAVSLAVVGSLLAGEHLNSLLAIVFPGKSVEGIMNAHGRTTLWTHYLEMIKTRPLLGWGFAVMPRVTTEIYATSAHNSVLGIAGGLGLAGLLLLLIFMVQQTRELVLGMRRAVAGAKGCFAAFVVVFVNSLSNGAFGERATLSTIGIFIILGLSLSFAAVPLGTRWRAQPTSLWSTVRGASTER